MSESVSESERERANARTRALFLTLSRALPRLSINLRCHAQNKKTLFPAVPAQLDMAHGTCRYAVQRERERERKKERESERERERERERTWFN